MEKYFTYILELMNYISLKEEKIENIKKELKSIKVEINENLNQLCIENNKLSEIMLYNEENEETLKYNLIPIVLLIIYCLIVLFLLFSNLYNLKIIILLIPIGVSFPILKKISQRVKIKYAKLREERKELIEDQKNKREKVFNKQKELKDKEDSLKALLEELELEVQTKKEHLNKLQTTLIKNLAPTLDKLIEEEITKNNNPELQAKLAKIREI